MDISVTGTASHSAPRDFPFRCVLSFDPLVESWRRMGKGGAQLLTAIRRDILRDFENTPELHGSIDDLSVLDRHRDLVSRMMCIIFPPATWERDYVAAFTPFRFNYFYTSPAFARLNMMEDSMFTGLSNMRPSLFAFGKTLNAFLVVGRKFYNLDLNLDYPLIYSTTDPQTGLPRHFKISLDPDMMTVKSIGQPPPLTDDDRKRLMSNLLNLDVWMELIPPQHFEFHGFGIARAVDVTTQEVLSTLKMDLIDRRSIVSDEGFSGLQSTIRTLFNEPELVLSLAAIDEDEVFFLNSGLEYKTDCLATEGSHYRLADFSGSIFEKSAMTKEIIVIEDLTSYPAKTEHEEELSGLGLRNVVVAPLFYRDQLIGMMSLGSNRPGVLNDLDGLRLREVLPLFSMAIKRSVDDLNNNVQAVIKEKCTAIHPSVEWRFRRAALKLISREGEEKLEMEDIVFENVYPLYALSDIRGSSHQRTQVIRDDLIHQLQMAREVVVRANNQRRLPILDNLRYRLDRQIEDIASGLSAGDEIGILEFLHREVENLFDTLVPFGNDVRDAVTIYRSAIDPVHGFYYGKRKDFEESVTLINETVSAYIDQKEVEAQRMFPHYFEKYKTDGVDFGMYIGASLVENGRFDPLYLRNLRLWQLMVMCGVARVTERLGSRMKIPLRTTQLILVQDTPMSIRFRYDEKHFDVDGAYNIRYEIVKKRIDKAMIKGTRERLTQPGTVAIVYAQPKEAYEYREYIDFLVHNGHLRGDLESFELEDLQGIQGLKALRVTVNLEAKEPGIDIDLPEISSVVREMTPTMN